MRLFYLFVLAAWQFEPPFLLDPPCVEIELVDKGTGRNVLAALLAAFVT